MFEIKYQIYTEGEDVIPCDSCSAEVATSEFSWEPPYGEPHERPHRYLCEFCASSYVSNITRYSPRDEAGYLRKETAILIAQAVNHLSGVVAGGAAKDIQRLENDLQRERLRLAACGAAALGYYNGAESEADNLYGSASLDDVLRLRAEVDELRPFAEAALDFLRDYRLPIHVATEPLQKLLKLALNYKGKSQ